MAALPAPCLNIQTPNFLTDSLSLAKMAATRNIRDAGFNWTIRPTLATYIAATKDLQATVYHIKRDINGVAHNLAHQHLSPQAVCYSNSHDNANCQFLSTLASLRLSSHVISAVHCF